jgi:hypothetical protein
VIKNVKDYMVKENISRMFMRSDLIRSVQTMILYPKIIRRHREDEHNYGHRACHVCGKQFSSQVGFDHHIEDTHGNGSFPCDNCGEIY